MKKYFPFFILIVVLIFIGYFAYSSNLNKVSRIKELDHTKDFSVKESFSFDNLPEMSKGVSVSDRDGWSNYTNNKFRFEVKVPYGMRNIETLYVYEQGGFEYSGYGVDFSDYTNQERIFYIDVVETSFNSIDDYMFYHKKEYAGYNIEKIDSISVDAVLVTYNFSKDSLVNPDDESVERRLMFVRGGFVFKICTGRISIDDVHRIWESFKFMK